MSFKITLAMYSYQTLAVWLLTMVWAQLAQTQSAQYPLLPNQREAAPLPHDEDRFMITKTVFFEVNPEDRPNDVAIHENISSTIFPRGVTGGIEFVPGEWGQQHKLTALVRLSSNNEIALNLVSIRNDTRNLFVDSASVPSPSLDSTLALDPALKVDIVVFIKPQTFRLRKTHVSTVNLNIQFFQDIWFETYYLTLSAVNGFITGLQSPRFMVQDINITSHHGPILGNWSLSASASFTTLTNNIYVNLFPTLWSAGPYTTANIFAQSEKGNIDIRMPFEPDKLSLRNGSSIIETRQGSITGTLVHCGETVLKAGNEIDVKLLPYWAFYNREVVMPHNYITTESGDGNTTVEVLPPVYHRYYKMNPLFFAVSRHVQGDVVSGNEYRRMKLVYPGQWGGVATGYAGGGGNVDIRGKDFEEVERNGSVVQVERRPLGSQLWFEADAGSAELVLEPCYEVGCGFPEV
ncbi:unnamed protein product [Periconia digitata]|uniref:Uncharacterized protein n=1 Tax=Periconia digitata TaxID=1303443 RepID=A0A9W4UB72_9PLEO|nr:unnamed protein product [Periconia digitata]